MNTSLVAVACFDRAQHAYVLLIVRERLEKVMVTGHRIHSVLAATAAIWLLCSITPVWSQSGVIQTRFFTVRYHSADPFLAEIVADTADAQLQRVARDLDYPLKGIRRFPLDAYPNHYEFLKAGGLERRSPVVGTTRYGDESISVDAGDVLISTQEVLAHEITHAVVFRLLGPSVSQLPTWFSEGLAKHESQESDTHDNDIIARAAAESSVIPLTRLASGFPEDQDSLAYAESASAVRYLVRRFGKSAPRRILHEVKATGSFERAMVTVTGLKPVRFSDDWYDWTTRRYARFRFVSIMTALISAFMALLAIAAFLARRKRKIEAARRWEMEEMEASKPPWSGNPLPPWEE